MTFALSPSIDITATDYNMTDATYMMGQSVTSLKAAVTGAGTGDVTITAKAGDKTATATITVTPAKYNVK